MMDASIGHVLVAEHDDGQLLLWQGYQGRAVAINRPVMANSAVLSKSPDYKAQAKPNIILDQLRPPHFLKRFRFDQARAIGEQSRGEARQILYARKEIARRNRP